MMFPVNRKANELTATELLKLYDEARRVDLNHVSESQIKTVQELRAEIERRLTPPAQAWQQQQAAQSLGLGQGNR